MLNRPADALASYERGLALDPRSAQLHCNRGNMLYELKRLDEALSAYDKALSLQPDLGEAWVGRGNAYADLQRFDAAFAAFERALSLNPRLDNAWLGRANALSDLGRQAEAVSAYERALTLNPDLENAWLGRGSALYDLRRFDEALTAFDKAFQLRPDLISAEGARLNCKMTICDWRTVRGRRRTRRPIGEKRPALHRTVRIPGGAVDSRGPTSLRRHLGRAEVSQIRWPGLAPEELSARQDSRCLCFSRSAPARGRMGDGRCVRAS